MEIKLDPWQKKVLETKGNMCICSGRQVGKSTIISQDAGEYAVHNSKKVIMIVAHVERQALLLFEKVLSYIYLKYKSQIKTGKDKPTKHTIKLKNGTVIHCLPTGDSGYGIRGYTIDRLYADEAAYIKEDVWAAITPMLATTGGYIILLSTPFGTEGYFYRCFHDEKFTRIHVNTEEVAQGREEPQKTQMINFLKDEKERMSPMQYQQEYLGLFVGGIQKFFPNELIDKCCILKTHSPLLVDYNRYLGVDVARMGGDETVLVSLELRKELLYQFDLTIPARQTLTDTTRLILHKDLQYDYKEIYIDATGMGWGVFDPLKEHEQTKRKVVAIENVKKSLSREIKIGKKKSIMVDQRKITMKEDLYNNLRNLMQNNKICLLDRPEIRQSLRSIQYDNSGDGLKIYGNYSHIAEALIRAAWCVKTKRLNMWVAFQ